MLKISLIWGLAVLTNAYMENWLEDVFPKRDEASFSIIPKDNKTGCKGIRFPVGRIYIYADSCESIPSDYPVMEKSIHIRATKVKRILYGDFDKWINLERLSIEMNAELEEIQAGSFMLLGSLQNLSISNNYRLKWLDKDVFEGLNNLKELNFIKNGIKDLENFIMCVRPSILPSLESLDLSENVIDIITKSDLIHLEGSMINKLSFQLCGIMFIEADSFATLVHLKSLNLGNNNLQDYIIIDVIRNMNATANNFTELILSSNLLNKKPYVLLETIATTGIKQLDLKENHFDSLTAGFFPKMPYIESLDVSNLKAVVLENGTFNKDIMPNLKKLIIAKNRFPGTVAGFLLPNIVELDVSENTCQYCFGSSLFKIGDYDLKNMRSLDILNLSKNNIYHVRRFMFFGLSSLRALFLSNCSIYIVDKYAFENLTSLEHLDLSHNQFVTSYAISRDSFFGLGNLISLRLDHCGMTYFPEAGLFDYLTGLKYLTLANNALIDFNPMIFSTLGNIAAIDFSFNDLLEWETAVFTRNRKLKTLLLISNQIAEITVSMLKDFENINFVDISENPFVCTCKAVSMINEYLASFKNRSISLESIHLNDTKNYCFSPRQWKDTELIVFLKDHQENNICGKIDIFLIILLTLGFSTIVLFITCLLYYLRWHIRYWIFLFRQTMRYNYFPNKNANKTDLSKYKYDAFISYSNEDRSFVVRLVTMLESQPPYFNLCVFERDFKVGGSITDSVVDCLAVSKRAILILSDSFARSTWCLWEMQMAQHRRMFFKDEENEPLIIIKIGEIMEKHMTPILRYLIRTRVYLQWNSDPKKQKFFWQKLRAALSNNNAQNGKSASLK